MAVEVRRPQTVQDKVIYVRGMVFRQQKLFVDDGLSCLQVVDVVCRQGAR